MTALGIDVGGTKIAFGLVAEDGTVSDRRKVKKPPGPMPTVDAIASIINDAGAEVDSVGLAVAGFVEPDQRTVSFAANIGWEGLDLVAALPSGRARIIVENDANAAGWAEFVAGAGRDATNMLMVTVGTGIGGGVVTDGHLVRGAHGGGGEIGHIRFVAGGIPCGCGLKGCWEQYASGSALVRDARAAAEADPAAAAVLIDLAGGDPGRIAGKQITRCAVEGDPFSTGLLRRLGTLLGEGIGSVCSVIDPDVVVVGGGVADAGDLLLDPVRESLAQNLTGRDRRPVPEVCKATLGNDAGVVGAGLLSR